MAPPTRAEPAGGFKRPPDPSPIYYFLPICQFVPPIEIISENTGPSSFPIIMSLKVVFQICFGSIKMMGMRGVLVPRSGQLSYSIYVSKRPAEPLVYLGHPVVSLFIRVNQLSAYLSGSNNCQLIYLGQPIVSLFIWVNQLSAYLSWPTNCHLKQKKRFSVGYVLLDL